MAATLTAYNDALKRIWTQQRLEEQLYNETPFLSRIEKVTRHKVGEVARVPLHVSRNGGYSATPNAGSTTLNTAGNQGLSKAEYNYTNHHQLISVDGSAIDGTSGNSLSVAEVVDTEVTGALTDLKRQLQRQLFLAGNCRIATTETSSSANTIQLNTTSGVNAIDRGWLFVGLPIDLGTSGNPDSLIAGEAITAIDATNYDVTVTTNVTGETGAEFVSVKDSESDDGATHYEMNGLQNLVDSADAFGGLTVAGEPTWKSAENSTSQALTLSLMLQQDQAIHQATGSKADFVLTGLKQERKFYELLQNQVRYQSDNSLSAGAQENVKWKGMEIFCDPDCQDEYMYFGKLKHVFIVAIDKPYWQNKVTGGNILDWTQGQDAYGGKLTYRINLATNKRNAFAKLSALT